MRPGQNGELIIEGATEAKLAAHFLGQAGVDFILKDFEPPIPEGRIGLAEFALRRAGEAVGRGDSTEHVLRAPAKKVTAIENVLAIARTPNSITSILFLPKAARGFTRRGHLSNRFDGYLRKREQLKPSGADLN